MVRPYPRNPTNIATVRYLESIGLNPHHILQDGVDKGGYYELALDSHGNRVFVSGELSVTWKQWPPTFSWTMLNQCMRYDGIWPGGEMR